MLELVGNLLASAEVPGRHEFRYKTAASPLFQPCCRWKPFLPKSSSIACNCRLDEKVTHLNVLLLPFFRMAQGTPTAPAILYPTGGPTFNTIDTVLVDYVTPWTAGANMTVNCHDTPTASHYWLLWAYNPRTYSSAHISLSHCFQLLPLKKIG